MTVALGRSSNDEYKPDLSRLSSVIKGDCGLMFTDAPLEEVVAYFDRNEFGEYARTGFVADVEFCIPQGPLDLPFSMEPTLRQLGLDTKLNKGIRWAWKTLNPT